MTMALVAAGVGAVGAMGAASLASRGGGGGESSVSPYFAAAPGLVANANFANGMQGAYMSQPFNAQQRTAANNIYGQSDYMRGLVPSLLMQMQSQPLGFDPSNPSARPRSWDWTGLMQSSADTAQQGLRAILGPTQQAGIGLLAGGPDNSMVRAQQQADARAAEASAAAAAAAQSQRGPVSQAFTQANMPDHMAAVSPSGLRALGGALAPELMQASGGGGYGGFQYGMNVRDIAADPRLEADARLYFAMGGNDPFDVYSGRYMADDRRRALQDQTAADRLWNQP